MKVTVENFQSIKRAEIDVDGFTVITGPNNSGKTALMRAIRGAFQNAPGSAFIRHGEKECRVEVDLGDTSFTWEKGKKPAYEIDGKVLHPGKNIPDEIAETGVTHIMAGGEKIWPQMAPQFTGQVFLVDKPGSALAEAVADVERVGKLNRALKSAESDKRSATSEAKVRKKDLEAQQDRLQAFDGLDDVQAQVEALEAAAERTGRIEQAIVGLDKLSTRLADARDTVDSLSGVDSIVVPSRDAFQSAVDLGRECKDVERLGESLISARAELERFEPLNAALETAKLLDAVEEIDLSPLSSLDGLKASLVDARTNLLSIEKEVSQALKELSGAKSEVEEILGGMSECPTCGAAVGSSACHEEVSL